MEQPNSAFRSRRALSVFLACWLIAGLVAGGVSPAPRALAAFPGANGKIAFVSDGDGNVDIYVMNADGSEPLKLTNHPAVDYSPSWSPDGSRIAFVSYRDGNGDIYVMNADGSEPTRLTDDPGSDDSPAWSPDGSKIVFVSERGGFHNDIYVMNADGSDVIRLTDHVGFERTPTWSPDGSRIAFVNHWSGNGEIYVMNTDGSEPTNLTNSPEFDGSPDWSPDGSRIVFERYLDQSIPDIFVMNADGSAQTNLTNHPDADDMPSWSPDGSRIAFVSYRDGNAEIYIMNADGSLPINVTNAPGAQWYHDWQPIPGCAVLVVPGVAGTYAADIGNDQDWLLNRGVAPDDLQIDPLAHVYDDLIQTLENVGYVQGEDLFVANYDWRLPPGPIDGTIDGTIQGLSGSSLTDNAYAYAVDYLGHYLREAVEAREEEDPDARLECVDIIAHSTGGLVTRAYMQSTAYRATFMSDNGERSLPRVDNVFMIGVPNRGASKAWNPLHDNWVIDRGYRVVLSKIINRAYQKVLDGLTISGPDHLIDRASIDDGAGNPDPEAFIQQYVPTLRSLLATYDFLDNSDGAGFTNVNSDPDWRNAFVLDLNDGLDLQPTADPSPFANLSTVTVIYAANQPTATSVIRQVGADGGDDAVLPFTDYAANDTQDGEVWYHDIVAPTSGDGTVPLDSSIGQFVGDDRVTLLSFSATHTGLVGNAAVQQAILETLDVTFEPADIATGSEIDYTTALSVTFDPVEGFVVDANGNRLGYSAATGAVTEIPYSVWFGTTDGFGLVYGALQTPLTLELSGLGEDHYVMVAIEQDGQPAGGAISEGFLAAGETRSLPVPLATDPPAAIESYAIFAARDDCGDGSDSALQWNGSSNTAGGDVHSNGGFRLSGSKNHVDGATTYHCDAHVSGSTNTFAEGVTEVSETRPWPSQLTSNDFTCDISASGKLDLSGDGPWWVNGKRSSRQLNPLTLCATEITLSGSSISGMVTLVAGTIRISGSNLHLTTHQHGVLAVATGADNAIGISGSGNRLTGDLIAPFGHIHLSGSRNTLIGSVAGSTVGLSGSNWRVGNE